MIVLRWLHSNFVVYFVVVIVVFGQLLAELIEIELIFDRRKVQNTDKATHLRCRSEICEAFKVFRHLCINISA